MRLARNLRKLLCVGSGRGCRPLPLRPGSRRGARRRSFLAAGGVLSGGPAARRFALELVRGEIRAGTYVGDWRLDVALDRLIAAML